MKPVAMLAAVLPLLAAVRADDAAGAWDSLPPLPDPRGVASPFAGVSHGVVIVAGGANFPDKMPWEGGRKVWHDAIRVLERPDGAWRTAGRLPRPLAYGVSVTCGNVVVAIGGSDAERHHAEVLTWEWRDGALAAAAWNPGPLPVALANAAGAVDASGNVFVACGSHEPGEQAASRRVFMVSSREPGAKWRELPELPGPARLLPVAAADGDAFFVFGGAALERSGDRVVRRYLKDAWRWSPREGWKALAEMPAPCVAAPSPAPVADGCCWLIGGDDGSRVGFAPPERHPGFPGTVFRYRIAADRWEAAGRAPAPRATLPCVPMDGRFVLPSGEVRPGVRSPEVWRFAPEVPAPR